MGKSSSGKDTIYKELLQRFPKMKRIVLYTTRPRREGERDGVEYFFTDEEKLQQFRKQGQLIEERSYHTQYGVWSYFTADDGQINLPVICCKICPYSTLCIIRTYFYDTFLLLKLVQPFFVHKKIFHTIGLPFPDRSGRIRSNPL